MEVSDFYDLKRLFHVRDVLQGLDPAHLPRAIAMGEGLPSASTRIGFLSGSFNPPTLAHVELALQAKKSLHLDRLIFVISKVTVDKERVEGLLLEDRLLLLSLLAENLEGTSVVLVNRGLYFEQTSAYRSLLGNRAKIYLIVGLDKVMQIFDPHYYEDRDAALKTLFAEAQMIAAGRGHWEGGDLERLLTRTENQVFQDRVYPLELSEGVREISSSALRAIIAAGKSFEDQLPELVQRVLTEIGAYRPRYEYRQLLLDLLYRVREWAEKECDFRALDGVAGEESQRGERLRELLRSARSSSSQLKEALSVFLRS
ncbi:MAG: hypothetical protein QF619_08130 [Candidatus Binatia bacterium]|nr:hypothetical protein [Candidatus Binatia bacterium]